MTVFIQQGSIFGGSLVESILNGLFKVRHLGDASDVSRCARVTALAESKRKISFTLASSQDLPSAEGLWGTGILHSVTHQQHLFAIEIKRSRTGPRRKYSGLLTFNEMCYYVTFFHARFAYNLNDKQMEIWTTSCNALENLRSNKC